MSEVWAAALGAVISTGIGVAANAATAPGFGGAAPIKPKLIDTEALNKMGIDFDTFGYQMSDADLAKRLPGLVTGRDALIDDTYKQLNGPLDPTIQNSFMRNALEKSLASTGAGGSVASTGGPGSAMSNAVAASLGNDVEQKQDQDRANLAELLNENPERSFGLTGPDALALAVGNAQAENQYNVAKYQFQTQKDASSGGF